jgi:hypothetical protein
MPRYFFNLADGVELIDRDGIALPSLEAAKSQAIKMANTFESHEPGGRLVVVTDEAGAEVYRTPVTG